MPDGRDDLSPALRHGTYIASLPPPTELTTPLFFSDAELACLAGTNLAGAVSDRRKEWMAESEAIRAVLRLDGLTW
jgi:hypothetical protein